MTSREYIPRAYAKDGRPMTMTVEDYCKLNGLRFPDFPEVHAHYEDALAAAWVAWLSVLGSE